MHSFRLLETINKMATKKATTEKKKVIELSEQDAAILVSIIAIVRDNVGKYGLQPDEVGNLYSNCNAFINLINK